MNLSEMTETFSENWTLEEYKEIIKICLVDHCSWTEYRNHPERVEQLIKREEIYIVQSFEEHQTPMDTAVEIGFGCG